MRKVLSFVLVLSLVLGSFGMAFAATGDTTQTSKKTELSDIDGLACEDAVRVLVNLNVVSGYENGTYKPEQTVTRAEMASLIINALGLKETNAVPKFADSKTHWAKGYIAYANTLGIISGRSETTFDPDATVTYDEATTMLVKSLGYTDDALVGTYPASFVSRAKVLGILDGIKTGTEGANRGDIATMLYQTLDQAIGKVDKDGNFVATVIEWTKGEGNATNPKKYDTMLDRLGAEIASKSNLKSTAAWRDDINDDAFIVSGEEDTIINLTPFKGAAVSAYVNTDGEILAIKELFSSFVSGTIKDDVLSLADGTEYTLKADAVSDLTGDAEKFENGDNVNELSSPAEKDLKERAAEVNFTLAVELGGKKINEVHSVLFWNVTKYDLLESDDLTDITKNHKMLGVDFDEDNDGEIDTYTFELVGVETLNDIKADMAAYVYRNGDDKIARVAVGPVDRISGEAAKVNSDGTKVTIEGTTYKYAKEELSGNGLPGEVGANEIEAGDEVVLTMDAYGYIYDCNAAGDSNYAVVLRVENDSKDSVTGDAQLKLLLADGTSKIFSADKDDITSSAIDANGKWKTNVVTTGALVKYNVDKSGVIDDLSVIVGANGALISTEKDLKSYRGNADITAKGYYDGKQLAADAVLFNYEGNDGTFNIGRMSDKTDDYSIAKYESALESEDVDAYYIYDTNKKKIVTMLMDNATSANDIFGIVNSKGTNNSSAGAYYNMLIDGKEVTYNGTDSRGAYKYDVSTKNTSDLYRVKFDASGDIKEFASWNNGKDKVNYAKITVDSSILNKVEMNNRTFAAPTGKITNEYYNGSSTVTTTTTTQTALTIDRDAVVYVYERVADEWKLGNTSDLRAMKATTVIKFYDVIDEDGIYDIILIDELKATSAGTSGDGGGSDETPIENGGTLDNGTQPIASLDAGTTYDIKLFEGGSLVGSIIEDVRGPLDITAAWLDSKLAGCDIVANGIDKTDAKYELVLYKAGEKAELKTVTFETKNVGPRVSTVANTNGGSVSTAAFATIPGTFTVKTAAEGSAAGLAIKIVTSTGAVTPAAGVDSNGDIVVSTAAVSTTTWGAVIDAIENDEKAKKLVKFSDVNDAIDTMEVRSDNTLTLSGGTDAADATLTLTMDEKVIAKDAAITLTVNGQTYKGTIADVNAAADSAVLTVTIKGSDLKAVIETGDKVKVTEISGVIEKDATALNAVVTDKEFTL